MTRSYRTLGEIDPNLFADIIRGSSQFQEAADDDPAERRGLMLPTSRFTTTTQDLQRYVQESEADDNSLANSILADVARSMAENATDRERLASAVARPKRDYDIETMGDPALDLDSLPPIEEFLGSKDQTREALGTPDPVNVEQSTQGAGVEMVPANGEPVEEPVEEDVSTEDSLTETMMQQLEIHEGRKDYPYRDSRGLWTIGVGHLIGDGSDEALAASEFSQYSEDNPMPDEKVSELFREDYESHAAIAESYSFFDDMSVEGKRAIIDLTFNMGDFLNKKNEDGTYMWANLRRQLENGEWDAAADNLLNTRYARQVGNRAVTVANLLRQAGG